MARWGCLILLILGSLASGAQEPQASQPQYQEPREEDEAYRSRQYSFNPLQAEQEFRIGEFYYKKGSWKAAIARYEEAIHWNPGFTQAYRKLALANEKLAREQNSDTLRARYLEAACQAWRKLLELEPQGKQSRQVQERVEKLEGELRVLLRADQEPQAETGASSKPPAGGND